MAASTIAAEVSGLAHEILQVPDLVLPYSGLDTVPLFDEPVEIPPRLAGLRGGFSISPSGVPTCISAVTVATLYTCSSILSRRPGRSGQVSCFVASCSRLVEVEESSTPCVDPRGR